MSETLVGGILLIGVEPELGAQVQRDIEDNEDIGTESMPDLQGAIDWLERHYREMLAVVIGPGIEEPLKLTQRIHRLNREISVLILNRNEHHARISRALHFTPFLSDHVTSHLDTDTTAITDALRDAVQRGRQRRRFRSTISVMNEQLQSLSAHRIPATLYLDHVLDHAPVGVLALDLEGQIISINQRAAEILGQSDRALVGSSLERMFPDEELHRVDNFIARAGLAGRQGQSEVFSRRAASGETQFISVTAATISEDPRTLGTLVILQDVTEQVISAREREAALQVRDEFLSVAAHELKTPLTSIKGFVELLGRQVQRSEWDQTRITRLHEQLRLQVSRLELLISNLLDASSMQQGWLEPSLEPLDLVELARAVLQRFEDALLATPDHQVTLDAPDPVMGVWDAQRVDQVITNLVSNALKYSPSGGQVGVIVRRDGDHAVLEIHDDGVGIDPELQSRIFHPFVRGEIRGDLPGTGLGLHITSQIVEQHGGTISVASTPGLGSTFTVRLPLNYPGPRQADGDPPASRSA